MKSSLRLVLGSVAALGLAGVFVLSFIQVDKVPRIGLPSAIEHLIAYALVCLVLTLLLGARLRPAIAVAIGFAALGGVIELGQLLTATRSPSWGDFFGNAAGAVLGAGAGWVIGLAVRRARRATSHP